MSIVTMSRSFNVDYYENHKYFPFVTDFGNNAQIRISTGNKYMHCVPGNSKIYIEGTLTYTFNNAPLNVNVGNAVLLTNNAYAFFFDTIIYKINNVEVDRTTNLGVLSTAKILLTYRRDEVNGLENAGWGSPAINVKDNSFNTLIPLEFFLSFAQDFKGIVYGQTHELLLDRATTDENAYMIKDGMKPGTTVTFNFTEISWLMPHVKLSPSVEAIVQRNYSYGNLTYSMFFRSWDSYTFERLRASRVINLGPLPTMDPAFIIVAFQTNRSQNKNMDASKFDHVNLRSFKVLINNTYIPYNTLNEDFENDKFLIFYQNYIDFMGEFFRIDRLCNPILSKKQFKEENPIFVIRCEKRDPSLENHNNAGLRTIWIELEAREKIQEGTVAHVIVIRNKTFFYKLGPGAIL
ncbi:unnamed protein product [Bemisia tabaci]|uniref:Double jelly roll-like domain-containing protein n=1 Tax=Bemisia tabaci TaxID=7038 RepID=A0A9P0CEX8_BEMTA|nr:unnamed protein product [Bemisia tabaci]